MSTTAVAHWAPAGWRASVTWGLVETGVAGMFIVVAANNCPRLRAAEPVKIIVADE